MLRHRSGEKRRDTSIGFNLRRIEVELPAPNQARLLTQIDDSLEEALEDIDPEALPDAGQAGVVGQVFIKGVAAVPAMRQVETRGRDEVPLGADPLEDHHQLQLEEDDRVDGGPTTLGIQLSRPITDEAQVELGLQVPVEVGLGNECFQRDRNRLVEVAGSCGTEHRDTPEQPGGAGKPGVYWPSKGLLVRAQSIGTNVVLAKSRAQGHMVN